MSTSSAFTSASLLIVLSASGSIAIDQRLDGVADLLLDEPAHRQDVLTEVVQLFFVVSVGVLCVHRASHPKRPVM